MSNLIGQAGPSRNGTCREVDTARTGLRRHQRRRPVGADDREERRGDATTDGVTSPLPAAVVRRGD
jgi:hypothetical protein